MLKRRIPSEMEKIPLYAFVSMQNEGDEIEFIWLNAEISYLFDTLTNSKKVLASDQKRLEIQS